MKTKLTKTLALIAAVCGLQLFTATPAMAATVTGAKWGNIVTESGKGFHTNVNGGNNYNSFTLNLSKSDNLSMNDITGPGAIKITGIRILSRYKTTSQACPTVTLSQNSGATTVTSSSGTKTTWVVIYNSTGGSYTLTAFDVTFTSAVTFDTATAITMTFDEGKSLTVVQPMSSGVTCTSANYSPLIEITGDFTSSCTDHSATASGTCNWTGLDWDPAWPTGGGALHNANITVGSAATTLTINENETMNKLAVTSVAANDLTLALADGKTATVTTYDFSEAAGATTLGFDPGTTLVKAGTDTILNTATENNAFRIASGKKLTVKSGTVSEANVSNSGTLNFLGGTADTPIVYDSHAGANWNMGNLTLAASTYVKMNVYNETKAFKFTGAGAATSTLEVCRDGTGGQGMLSGTQFRNLTLAVKNFKNNNYFWIEQENALDETVVLHAMSLTKLNNYDYTVGGLWGSGTFAAAQDTRVLTIKPSADYSYSGSSSVNITIEASSHTQSFSGSYTGALTVNAGGKVALSGSANPSSLTLADGAELTVDSAKNLAVSTAEAGSIINKAGNGTLTIGTLRPTLKDITGGAISVTATIAEKVAGKVEFTYTGTGADPTTANFLVDGAAPTAVTCADGKVSLTFPAAVEIHESGNLSTAQSGVTGPIVVNGSEKTAEAPLVFTFDAAVSDTVTAIRFFGNVQLAVSGSVSQIPMAKVIIEEDCAPIFTASPNANMTIPSGATYTIVGGADASSYMDYVPNFTINGTLQTKGYIDTKTVASTIPSGGHLKVLDGNLKYYGGGTGVSGTVTVMSGATFTNGRSDSFNYNGSPVLNVYGTVSAGTTRISLGANCVVNLYTGGRIEGTGNNSCVLDYIDNINPTLYVKKSASASVAVIDAPIKIRTSGKNLTFDFEQSAHLECHKPIIGSGGIIKKTSSNSTMAFYAANTYTGATALNNGYLTYMPGSSTTTSGITVASGTALELGGTSFSSTLAAGTSDQVVINCGITNNSRIDVFGDTKVDAAITGNKPINVKNGGTLELAAAMSSSDKVTVENGGTLKTSADITLSSNSNKINASGVLEVVSGTLNYGSGQNGNGICGTLTVDKGATFVNTQGSDALHYNGSPTINVKGTVDLASTRWSMGGSCKLNLYPGCTVSGVGSGNNGALDFFAGNANFKVVDDGNTDAITLSAAMRFRDNDDAKTLDVGAPVTVNVSGALYGDRTFTLTGVPGSVVALSSTTFSTVTIVSGDGVTLAPAVNIPKLTLNAGATVKPCAGGLTVGTTFTKGGAYRIDGSAVLLDGTQTYTLLTLPSTPDITGVTVTDAERNAWIPAINGNTITATKSGVATWDSATGKWKIGDTEVTDFSNVNLRFNAGDNVSFGSAVTPYAVTMPTSGEVTITGQDNLMTPTMGAVDIPADATLVLASNAVPGFGVTGTGTLKYAGVAANADANEVTAAQLANFGGTFWITGGRHRYSSQIASTVTMKVTDGGQLLLEASSAMTWDNQKFILSGEGWTGWNDDVDHSALRIHNNITLGSGCEITFVTENEKKACIGCEGEHVVNATLKGTDGFRKRGSGTLVLAAPETQATGLSGDVVVVAGTLRYGNSNYDKNIDYYLGSGVTVESGATFLVHLCQHGSETIDESGKPHFETPIILNGGALNKYDGSVVYASIDVRADSSLKAGNWGKRDMIRSLTGSHKLTLTADKSADVAVFGGTFTGTLLSNSSNINLRPQGNALKDATVQMDNGKLFTDNTTVVKLIKMGVNTCLKDSAAIINAGTTLDYNGKGNVANSFTLNGGALINTGDAIGANSRQMAKLDVTAESTVGCTNSFGMVNDSYAAHELTLGANTLHKTGPNTFFLTATAVTGAGIIEIDEGTLEITANKHKDAAYPLCTFNEGTIQLDAGTLKVDSNGTLSLHGLTVNGGTIDNSGAITNLAALAGTVNFGNIAGTVGFANAVTIASGTTTLSSAAATALDGKTITVAEGATLDYSTFRTTATLTSASQGTIIVKLSGQDETDFLAGNKISLGVKIEGASYAGTVKVLHSSGSEMTANLTVEDGTIKAQSDITWPIYTYASESSITTSGAEWYYGDQATVYTGGFNRFIPSMQMLGYSETPCVWTNDVALNVGTLTFATYYADMTAVNSNDCSIAAGTIDATAAINKLTLDFDLGAANVIAGTDTVIAQSTTGTLTVGDGKKATLNKDVTVGPKNHDANGTIRYAGDLSAGISADSYMSSSYAAKYEFENATLTNQLQLADKPTIVVQAGDVIRVNANNDSRTRVSWDIRGGTVSYLSTGDTWFGYGDGYVFTQTDGTFTTAASSTTASGNVGFMLGYTKDADAMTFNISGGTFSVPDTRINAYQAATFNLSGSATLRAKGMMRARDAASLSVNVGTGATVEIGSYGWAAGIGTFSLNGGTLKGYETTTIANAISLSGASTLVADSGVTMTIDDLTVADGGSITLDGAGTIIFKNYRDAVAFAADSTVKVGYTANINDLGSFTVPGDVDMNRVEIYNLAGQKLEIKSTTGRTVTFDWEIEGAACWWDYGFNGNLVSVGSDTTEMTDEKWSGVTTIYNSGNTALLVGQGTPWRDASFPDEFTAVIFGKMVDQEKSLEIGFGSTSTAGAGATTPYSVAFACGNTNNDEVIMLVTEGTAVKKTVSMRVPNAYDADHLYAFTCQTIVEDETEKTVVKLYLDGKLLQSYKFDTKVILGAGFQVGSVHGGHVEGGYEKAPKTNTHAELDFLRVYRTVMSQAAMTAYAEEYPYESANGKATRTFAGNTTWTLTDAWKQTLDETETQQAKPNANTMVEIKATEDSVVTFDLSEAANYEQFDILTGSDITLKTGGTVKPSVVGITSIGADVKVDYDAIALSTVNVLEGQSLTFDMSSIDLSKIYETTVYELTGTVTLGDGAQMLAYYATNSVPAGRTVTFAPDPNNGHWKFTVTCEGPITGTVNKDGTWGADGVITWKMGESVIDEPDWTVLNSATLVVEGENSYTLAYGTGTRPATIAKAGTGTLAITAGNDGKTYVVDGGTLKFATITNQGTATVTVNPNGTFDMNGQGSSHDPKIVLTLAGGKLVNNGQDFAVNQVQFTSITLTADSTVGGTANMYFVSGKYAANTLQLGGHTLSKVDNNTFGLCNTTVKNGTLAVEAGTLELAHDASTFNANATLIVADAATLKTSVTQTFGGDMSRWSSVTGSVVVAGGELRLGSNASGYAKKGEYKFGKSITVNSGKTLYLHFWASANRNFDRDTKAILTTPVTLNGSRIYTQDGATWFDSITVNGTGNTMQFNYNKSWGIGSLNGDENAMLTLTRSSSESALQYFAIDGGDFNGTLSVNNTDGSAAADFWLSPKGTVLADATVQCQGTGRPTYIVIRDDATLGEVTGDKFAGIFGDGVAAHTVTLTQGTYAAPIKDISTGTSDTYPLSVVIAGNVTITGESAYTGTTMINADAKLDAQLGAGLPRASTITIAEGGQLVVDLENFVTVAETSPAYTFSGDLPANALDIKNQDKYPWISIGTSGENLGKVIIDETKLPFTGLHIVKMLPKHTSKTVDRDPNGRDSGWIDLVNYGPTETNLANFKIVRSNIGKKVKSDDKDLARLCSYTLPKGGTFRVYTSEEYETAEDFGGKGKEVAWFKTVGGVVTKLDAYEDGAIMVVPTKVNPKKFPMVRLYDFTNGKATVIDEIIVPCDMDDNMMLEVVANTNKLERRVVYPNGEKVECGPVVNSLYGVKDVKSDLDLMKPGKFAPAGQAYPVKIPVNPLMTNGKALDANKIDSVNLVYRVFDPATITVSNKVALTSRTITAEDTDVAKYGEGCLLWEGDIPAEAMATAGKLVQFRAEITDKGGKTWIYPNNMNPDIGYGWYGVVVEPTIIATPGTDVDSTSVCTNSLQTFLMFIDNANKAEMDKDIDDPTLTLTYGSRLAIYDVANHTYYDNVRIDLRGQTSRSFYKKSHGIRFNKVAPLVAKDPFTGDKYETRKTSFIAEYGDPMYLRQTLSLRLMRESGIHAPFDWPVRLYLNGTFYQLAFHSSRFSDEAVEDFYGLNKYGYSYKNVHQLIKDGEGAEKKTPDDDNEADMTVYNEFVNRINGKTADELTTDAMKHFNIPAWVNYLAAVKVTQEADDVWTNLGLYINKYDKFFNANGDDTMMPLAYDMNLSWGQWYYADDDKRGRSGIVATNDLMKSHPFYGGANVLYHYKNGSTQSKYNRGMEAILQNAQFREMLSRRLRTLAEQYLGAENATKDKTPVWDWVVAYTNAIAGDVAIDRTKWDYENQVIKTTSNIWVWETALPFDDGVEDLWTNYIVPRRKHLYDTHAAANAGKDGYPAAGGGYATDSSALIPETQAATETFGKRGALYFTDLNGKKPGEADFDITTDKILGICNTNNVAIDMSGWTVEGAVVATLKPGTVIPANGTLWIVDDRRTASDKVVAKGLAKPIIVNLDKTLVDDDGNPIEVFTDATDQLFLKDADGTPAITHEATIGTKYYITLLDAFNCAKADDIVTLLTDINNQSAAAVKTSVILYGDTNTLTGAGFDVADGQTLTIASGQIANGALAKTGTGAIVLIGGKYTEAGKAAYSTIVSNQYHFAHIGTAEGDYAYQVIPGAEATTDEIVLPVAQVDTTSKTNDTGVLAFSKEWLKEKGFAKEDEDFSDVGRNKTIAGKLNERQTNKIQAWENKVLGLDGSQAINIPVIAPVQTADPKTITFKIGNNVTVDKSSGAIVTYRVLSGTDQKSWNKASAEALYTEPISFALPDKGVQYYKLEVITTPAK